ncbi:MAG: single-stranded-DNA-specific exonuclease RecJ [Chloroflexota bacterium]|nr:single-stranded-DNA-specific exonuclease RecJ [Chloroflexota bacterium]
MHPDPLLAELLFRRNLRTPEAARTFLDPASQPPPEPSLLPGVERAVARLCAALDAGETIGIYGDYDADGVTSTALLARALRAASQDASRIHTRLPTRDEGYGLNRNAIDAFATAGVTLLIAIDCASSDHVHVAYAQSHGMEVIVLDHHQMNDTGPKDAIILSAQLAPPGPYRDLASVGLAYLLIVALARQGCAVGGSGGGPETALLDLVAIGTIGDVSPLAGINRSLVREGLRRMRRAPRAGIRALCRCANLDPTAITSQDIGFKLAPRLNAAGRMGDPTIALNLLLTDSQAEADRLAAEIEGLNHRRRAETRRISAEAVAMLASQSGWEHRSVLVITGADWNVGILGIVAGQLAERFHRPALVLTDDGVTSRGSARSVAGFDIAQALTGCADLLDQHGGHSQAAGLSLPTAHMDHLVNALAAAFDAADIPPSSEERISIEAYLPIERLTLPTANLVATLEPFGPGNEIPIVGVRGVAVSRYSTIGADASHLKLRLETPNGPVIAIFWGGASRSMELVRRPLLDLAVQLTSDRWNGTERFQAIVQDFRVAR